MAANVGLPPGFVLDGAPPASPASNGLPQGFVLDAPSRPTSPQQETSMADAAKYGFNSAAKSIIPVGNLLFNDAIDKRTVLDQGMQGATFGTADEASDAIGAGIAKGSDFFRDDENKLFADKSLTDVYKDARGASSERLRRQVEQNPGTSLVAGIAGGLLTGGAGASTKTGGAIANSLRTGGTAARIAKGFAAGAASGGLYGAGSAEDGHRLEGATKGALVGGAVGGAIPAVGAAVGSAVKGTKNTIAGATARNIDELAEAGAAIKDTSSKAYKAMRDAGVTFNKDASQKIISNLDEALKQSGPLNKRIHGNTIAVVQDLRNLAKKGELGLEELDQYRQLFGDMAGDIGNKSNARTASILRGSLDNVLDNLDDKAFKTGGKEAIEALKTGRAEYARARKFESIAEIVKKSDGDPNYLKRELKKFLDNPKKTRGFKPEELKALKEASSLTAGEGVMKMLGKFGFDLGNSRIGNTALPVLGALGTGMGAGTGAGAVVPVVGTAARQGQKYLARGKAENLLKVIEQGGKAAKGSQPLSPLLSAPGGAIGGAISGVESRAPQAMPAMNPAAARYPAKLEAPLPGKQSSIAPDIIQAEGVRDKVYKDHLKNRTIGIGFNMESPNAKAIWEQAGIQTPFDSAYKGHARLSEDEINRLANTSYQIAVDDAKALVPNFDKLGEHQQKAVVQLSYQLGGPKLGNFKNTLSAINSGNYEAAARQLLNSKLAKQTPGRAKKIARMLAENKPYEA